MKHLPSFPRSLPVLFGLCLSSTCYVLAQEDESRESVPPRDRGPHESRGDRDRPERDERHEREYHHHHVEIDIDEEELEEYIDLARQIGEELDHLLRRGLREAAEEMRRRLDKKLDESPEPRRLFEGHDSDSPEARIAHLHEAAEHLARAGMEEEAEEMRHRAEEMERDLVREREHRRMQGADRELRHLRERIGELERIVRDLQEENRELRELLHDRPL